ncbi:MAG: GNAT family N-acetyltransferase [Candidatus Omnitrophota bacterium]
MRESKNSRLSFSVTDTINDIPRQAWDNLFGRDVIEDYGYYKTLEEAKLKEFSLGYLIGKHNDNLVIILPFFIMDFPFDSLIRGPIKKLLIKFNHFLKIKLLFLGSPLTEEFPAGISRDEDFKTLIDNTLENISKFCGTKKIRGFLFYNLSEKNMPLIEYLKQKHFIKMESLPNTLLEIKADSIETYINGLSKNTRKDLKRKLKKSSNEARLTTESRENIDDISGEIYQLYLNNLNDSHVRFEVLTPEFFKNICKNMPGIARFFITYDRDKIVAFNLCLAKDNLCIDKFIGFDSALSHKYHLYFTTFCHNIAWCMDNGFRFYQLGVTDYHPKLRLGARLVPLYIYAKAVNPLLNFFIKLTAKFIEPKNLDASLKEM